MKFRTGSSAKYDKSFPKDQTWTKPGSNKEFRYVHETESSSKQPKVQQSKIDNDADVPVDEQDLNGNGRIEGTGVVTSTTPPPIDIDWTLNGDQAASFTSPQASLEWNSNPSLSISSLPHPQLFKTVPRSSDPTLLQAVLLRYFIDNLARWFDLCDPEKHFELVVPQRARQCPPLMNAILTASARHLTRAPEDFQIFMAPRLVELNGETAVGFHNEAIHDLMKLAADPDQVQNENLLAAAIILRFHEEIDAPLRQENKDSELFLRVTSLFITEQFPVTPHVPHSSPLINYSSTILESPRMDLHHRMNSTDSSSKPASLSGTLRPPRPEGLRQAGFWVAFRQEIYTSFLKQRAFTIPLSHCEEFRSWAPAEDAVWADRMIVFCADVLDFCYGSTDSSNEGTALSPSLTNLSPASAADRWQQLKQTERLWDLQSPASFAPIYSHEPDHNVGEVFPEYWYLSDCHVTGLQHLELARILLAVHDPTRPKLGRGHLGSIRQLSRTLKSIVLKLCGMAMGNRRTPPTLVTAYLGIAVCGDHFEDRAEQEALLGLLDVLQAEYGWPSGETTEGLKDAWGWNE